MCENNQEKWWFTNVSRGQKPSADNIWRDDALNREKFAEDLTRIVQNAAKEQSFAMSLHGDWGTGKTFLLKCWQLQLQDREGNPPNRPQAVYFNAWNDDFQADPLVAILGQMREDLGVRYAEKLSDEVMGKFFKLLAKTALNFARFYTGGAVDFSREDIASSSENILGEYKDMGESATLLRKCLTEISEKVKEETDFPLVFIVDELDRCRPTFAIEVLERIKHLFDVPNIVFVFGINKTELKESIRSVYGDINAEDYLRRFFDFGLVLPSANAKAYCLHRTRQYQNLEILSTRMVREFFAPITGYMRLSLRQVEHVIRIALFSHHMRLVLEGNNTAEARKILLFAILKLKKPALYADLANGQPCCIKVIDYFHGFLWENSQGHDSHEVHNIADQIEDILYLHACGNMKQSVNGEWQNIQKNFSSVRESPMSDLKFLPQRIKVMGRERAATHVDIRRRLANVATCPPATDVFALLDLTEDESHR